MTALPDIKTANKVVELILKNASIAVTGIWLADDDGVLNPANIKLVPGSIIPKAVGSSGLTPLQAPGRFDVSNLVLDDLRARIRHTLLVDRLGPIGGPRMTATEVMERASEMTRLLGATYGRLQAELLSPLLTRAVAILRRRGEIPDLVPRWPRRWTSSTSSPLARSQARQDVQETSCGWRATAQMGPEATAVVDVPGDGALARPIVWACPASWCATRAAAGAARQRAGGATAEPWRSPPMPLSRSRRLGVVRRRRHGRRRASDRELVPRFARCFAGTDGRLRAASTSSG